MKPLTDEELTAMLDTIESDRAERKEAWAGSAPDKARQAVCAFANDLPNHNRPGVVFVGVKDDGTPTHMNVTDQLLQTLSDMKTDGKIVPPPAIIVESLLADVGPNLGAINRSALIATDHVVIPLSADLLSLQGLGSMGAACVACGVEDGIG